MSPLTVPCSLHRKPLTIKPPWGYSWHGFVKWHQLVNKHWRYVKLYGAQHGHDHLGTYALSAMEKGGGALASGVGKAH